MSIESVLARTDRCYIEESRCEAFTPRLPNGCVSLLWLDPPYYGVKDAEWDNAWPSGEAFLAWIEECSKEWKRVLAPNGSIYVCASQQMAAGVEHVMAKRFDILNHIVWAKPNGTHKKACKEEQRAYFTQTERIIFAEQKGSDAMAARGGGGDDVQAPAGTSGDPTAGNTLERWETDYTAMCDHFRGFVFEPIRAYLDSERERAGVTREMVDAATGTYMYGHWFSRVQWALPTEKHYNTLRKLFNDVASQRIDASADPLLPRDHGCLQREYAFLRLEYEKLKEKYEHLRRYFSVENGVPTTDVWTYPFVQHYEGKHICEKPPQMLRDVILASSRPGDLVADFFGGSFVAAEQALLAGRRFIGCDMDPRWAAQGQQRAARGMLDAVSAIRVRAVTNNGPLFGG